MILCFVPRGKSSYGKIYFSVCSLKLKTNWTEKLIKKLVKYDIEKVNIYQIYNKNYTFSVYHYNEIFFSLGYITPLKELSKLNIIGN